MDRAPEPELMEEEEQARAYAQADFSEPHDRFVAELRARFGDEGGHAQGAVLDLGCGPADVAIRIARAFPGCRIHGVDGSAAMLRQGRAAVERSDAGGRVELFEALLPRDAPPSPPYDAVVSNSLLHHLADPAVLWRSIRSYAKPGAPVLVMDLARPRDRAAADRLVERHAAGESAVLRRDFLLSLLAAYTPREVRAQLDEAGLASFAVEPIGDRHLVVHGRAPGR